MSLENFGLQRASRILSPILFFFLLARLVDFHEKLQRLAISRYLNKCVQYIYSSVCCGLYVECRFLIKVFLTF
jgi:hypothetical protein